MQINIDKRYNAKFLADSAGLDKAWGNEVKEDHQVFIFMAPDHAKVESALETYHADYLAWMKSEKLERLAAQRREHEIKGPMGLTLDDKTVARLTAAATGLMLDETIVNIQWELNRGMFITLSRSTILGLAVLAVRHVQACFNHVAELTTAIKSIILDSEAEEPFDALNEALSALSGVDIVSDWPLAPSLPPVTETPPVEEE